MGLMMLSYLAPKIMTAAMLDSAVGAGDMLTRKYSDAPESVRRAWTETMRPALLDWRAALLAKETP